MHTTSLRITGILCGAAALMAVGAPASATPPTPGDSHDVVVCRAPNIEVSAGNRTVPAGTVAIKVWQDLGPLYVGVVMPTTVSVDWENLRTGAHGHLDGSANNVVELTARTGSGPVRITGRAESRTKTPGPIGIPITPNGRCDGRFTVA
ncbi:hypothetical protein [Tsukamurella paurometabola]|uniref:Uncharacterized protein n=1 Tax=Tsukamurella paurometabola TaxID=2061 RepID=A0A3P8KQH8_TSUPA|nr:hypothetical protein [Tsukamurella paurometabola]UEA81478.1 hypothetical protein LK411_13800 [Tsukamurella paurometabola]VDR38477.1 Uncharacterised protein [Tsukamurella paurometabola]